MPADSSTLNLTDFLEQVSRAMIETQRQLNRESIAYNQQLPDGVPPAHFAIPAVRADLRLGFRSLSQKGVDVVLFSNKEEKESYGESTVSFELVAAPPPPSSFAATQLPAAPSPSSIRQQALDRIEALVNATALHPDTRRTILGSRDTALLIPLGGTDRLLVLWPSGQASAESPSWSQMSVFVLNQGNLETSLYDAAPAEGFLRLASRSTLLERDKKELVDLVEALGDVLLVLGRHAASGIAL